jgi:hypothetical protein
MRSLWSRGIVAAVGGLLTCASAHAVTIGTSAGGPFPIGFAAVPYDSDGNGSNDARLTTLSFTVPAGSPQSVVISDIQVQLTGFSHTWIGDLSVGLEYLLPTNNTGNSDAFAWVFDSPGLEQSNFGDGSNMDGNYRFADGGADMRPIYLALDTNGVVPPGTYNPIGLAVDQQAGTVTNPLVTISPTFAGLNTAGTWNLYIIDYEPSVDDGSIGSFSLIVNEPIPEPATAGLALLGGLALAARRRRA